MGHDGHAGAHAGEGLEVQPAHHQAPACAAATSTASVGRSASTRRSRLSCSSCRRGRVFLEVVERRRLAEHAAPGVDRDGFTPRAPLAVVVADLRPTRAAMVVFLPNVLEN